MLSFALPAMKLIEFVLLVKANTNFSSTFYKEKNVFRMFLAFIRVKAAFYY